MEARSVIDFLKLIDSKELEPTTFYRGHACKSWLLLPSIARIAKPPHGNLILSGWQGVESFLIESFKKKSVPYMDFVPENRLEWLVHGQHHGLPTSLLDWTSNALKGLFFAVENPVFDSEDGIVYAGVADEWVTDTNAIEKIDRIICFESRHINSRLIAQEGCFTAFPLPDGFGEFASIKDDESESDLSIWGEILIPAERKVSIRKQLKKYGITYQSLFPGLEGITKSLIREFE